MVWKFLDFARTFRIHCLLFAPLLWSASTFRIIDYKIKISEQFRRVETSGSLSTGTGETEPNHFSIYNIFIE